MRQIGFLPAQTVAPVASGASYLATAILAPAGMDPVIDTFNFPCEEWDAVHDRLSCVDALLHDVRGRFLTELDSTRALLGNPTLLDSTQAAWEEFVDRHGNGESAHRDAVARQR